MLDELSGHSSEPFYSVVIPTRNRPELFLDAVKSVIEQTFKAVEIIGVIDGASIDELSRYKEIGSEYQGSLKLLELPHKEFGHGPGFNRNYGAEHAKGRYLCFLDDDDIWTDNKHLQKAFQAFDEHTGQADVLYSNQRAYLPDGEQKKTRIWIEDLIKQFEDNQTDISEVTPEFLLKSRGFAHLNCTIIRKGHFETMKGLDEGLRYEEDRDFYLRTLDSAKVILFSRDFVARHNIPEHKLKQNASTQTDEMGKLLYQLTLFEKGLAMAHNNDVIATCRRGKTNVLKKFAERFFKEKNYIKSAHYSGQVLGIDASFKWLLFWGWTKLLSMVTVKS